MDKNKLKEMAYKQQRDHLARAQIQALQILFEQHQPYKLSADNAMKYHDFVKSRLEPEKFLEFREIMKGCRLGLYDSMVTISKVMKLFKNHPDLLQGFGMFLPPSINIQVQTGCFRVEEETSSSSVPAKFGNGEKRESSSEIQQQHDASAEGDSTMEDIQEVENSEKASTASREFDPKVALMYYNKVKERLKNQPEIFNKFSGLLECVRKNSSTAQADKESAIYRDICDLFQNHEDLIEEFMIFVPTVSVALAKEKSTMANDELESNLQKKDYVFTGARPKEKSEGSNDELESNFQKKDYVHTGARPRQTVITAVNDPSIAAVGKYGSYNEHLFFDKVKKALLHEEVFKNFLKCLMLFVEDVVTRSELLKIVTPFLGPYPELLKQFKDIMGFKESGDNVEIIPMKIVNYEKHRGNPEVDLDIDYATGGRNGASYRALPKDSKQPTCSGRTQLCKEVLNDTWVSFPSWSEDSTFVTSCKTKYEEMMYRIEDERFELDMAIQANSHTIQTLENVQKKINKMTPEEKSKFSLDDHLGGTSTVLHQKALHRGYGDKTDELVEGLKRNPVVAIPIILKRLKGKDEEWRDKQKEFNNVWREQIDSYYLKSLDHQGINFKQNDSKSFRPKNLISEIEIIHAEKKANTVLRCSTPHFSLEFKEMCVFLDASNLICQYLKKLPGIFRDDRRRIELIIRNFIPDFFCFSRIALSADEAADDEEDEEDQTAEVIEIDNDNEGRNGHASPTGSAVLCKDEEFSDPEESNSVEENDNESEESDKNSFIEDSDIFDKLDTLQPTNLSYVLFFVSKNWYVLFRQFHLLCERLSKLLHESNKSDIPPTARGENIEDDEETVDIKPAYSELISKLSQLLSGAMDYSQFEDEARSLFGIHAYVSFTMDKLILNIVRQLQQIVADDICKQCTAFFYQYNKIVANENYSSALESSRAEYEYLKKFERIMDEEKCFRILWHKKDQTLTIELMEHEVEKIYDPYEVEKWSNYLDTYVNDDSVSEEILEDSTGLPVFLKRNLRHQMKFWERKVRYVENLWKKRHSPSFAENNPPKLFCKRKSDLRLYPTTSKKTLFPNEKLDESVSLCSEISTTTDSVADSTVAELVNPESSGSVSIAIDDSEKMDSTAESVMKDSEINEEIFDNDKEMCCTEQENTAILEEKTSSGLDKEDNAYEIEVSVQQALEVNTEENVSDNAMDDKVAYFSTASETQNEESFILYDELLGGEKSADAQDNNDVNICIRDSEENLNSVAAFHDITEESLGGEVVIDMKSESDAVEIVTIVDSGDEEAVAVSDTESVNHKDEPVIPEPKEYEVRPKRVRPTRKARPRRSRPQSEYRKRRAKKAVSKLPKKVKSNIRKQEEIDYSTFDYAYFSELDEEDKIWYLVMKDTNVNDDTEVSFTMDSYKLVFVQNRGTFFYRRNCLRRAKEAHQQVSEIQTSNFSAWHRVWLDRFVTPTMLKFCNDWFLKSDPQKFKLVRLTMSDCTKPPYIPYYKYRIKYYKN